jgi:hypothetical protein
MLLGNPSRFEICSNEKLGNCATALRVIQQKVKVKYLITRDLMMAVQYNNFSNKKATQEWMASDSLCIDY